MAELLNGFGFLRLLKFVQPIVARNLHFDTVDVIAAGRPNAHSNSVGPAIVPRASARCNLLEKRILWRRESHLEIANNIGSRDANFRLLLCFHANTSITLSMKTFACGTTIASPYNRSRPTLAELP